MYKNDEIVFNVFSSIMQMTYAAEAAYCREYNAFNGVWYESRVDLITKQLGMEFAEPAGNIGDDDWDSFRDLEYVFTTEVLSEYF